MTRRRQRCLPPSFTCARAFNTSLRFMVYGQPSQTPKPINQLLDSPEPLGEFNVLTEF